MSKMIKVGLDFDGVVAYNPFRIIRPMVSFFKRKILKEKKLRFWYPKKRWQQIFWIILHESSLFPAMGTDFLKKLVKEGQIEAHLVTARYSFLDEHLYRWLEKYKLRKIFKTIHTNKKDEQPHLFKERVIESLELDYFIEDNWDIVKYLSKKQKTKIYWIYNLLDRWTNYPDKFPYLEKALEKIMKK